MMNFELFLVLILISYVALPSMGQVGSPLGSADVPVPKEDLKNLDRNQKMNQAELLTARTGQPVGLASQLNQLEAEFGVKMEEIKTQMSRSFKDQNERITKVMSWEHKLGQLLNQSMEVIKDLKTQNRDQSKRIGQLEQKLTKLENTSFSSPTLIRANTKDNMKNRVSISNTDGSLSSPSTPPSSCKDLLMLGYYLDGLFLVKNQQTKKIQTVFCQFSTANNVSQQVIGNVDVKTKTIHFYVQRNNMFTKERAIIPFELERLNEGRAFNLGAGVFTVPVSGIYHFQASAVKLSSVKYLSIRLQVNGVVVSEATTNQPNTGSYDVASLSSSLRLTANDKVNLFNQVGVLSENSTTHQTHFIGWLVEEDLLL